MSVVLLTVNGCFSAVLFCVFIFVFCLLVVLIQMIDWIDSAELAMIGTLRPTQPLIHMSSFPSVNAYITSHPTALYLSHGVVPDHHQQTLSMDRILPCQLLTAIHHTDTCLRRLRATCECLLHVALH